jgi:hypothetical protein
VAIDPTTNFFVVIAQKKLIGDKKISAMLENFGCQHEQPKIFSHQTRKVNNFSTDCGDHLD